VYKLSEDRKKDQKLVDSAVFDVISKHPEKSMLQQYLSSRFGLSNGDYPHKMVF